MYLKCEFRETIFQFIMNLSVFNHEKSDDKFLSIRGWGDGLPFKNDKENLNARVKFES